MPNLALAVLKKTYWKKRPLSGRFARKTAGRREKKTILFRTFSRFGGFVRL
jgi:hypothetical protein